MTLAERIDGLIRDLRIEKARIKDAADKGVADVQTKIDALQEAKRAVSQPGVEEAYTQLIALGLLKGI